MFIVSWTNNNKYELEHSLILTHADTRRTRAVCQCPTLNTKNVLRNLCATGPPKNVHRMFGHCVVAQTGTLRPPMHGQIN